MPGGVLVAGLPALTGKTFRPHPKGEGNVGTQCTPVHQPPANRAAGPAPLRQAAQAITYAYMRLGEELRIRGKATPRQSRFKVYRTHPKLQQQPNRTKGTSDGLFHTVETTVNGRREKIQQYPSDITWEEARSFQTNPDYELPDVTLEPEYHTTGATAHFEAGSYPTGWGRLYIDNELIGDRVRCYPSEA